MIHIYFEMLYNYFKSTGLDKIQKIEILQGFPRFRYPYLPNCDKRFIGESTELYLIVYLFICLFNPSFIYNFIILVNRPFG